MTGRHLGTLIVVAIVAIAGAFWASSVDHSDSGDATGTELFPGLADDINDVTAIRLYSAAAEPAVTLTRGEQTWQIGQKSGYRADTAKIKKLLLALAEAHLIEEKTSNPEFYERLGVQDIAGGGNTMIELDGVDGSGVIIGDSVAARQATYVRRNGEAASWLVNTQIDAASDAKTWLDTRLIDIEAARIAQVDIVHADGEQVSLSKERFGQSDFSVANIPVGRELKRANIANPGGAALAGLNFDDVVTDPEFVFPEPATRVRFGTFDGLVINAELATVDEQHYARFSAAVDAALPARYQQQTGDDSNPTDTTASADNAAAAATETAANDAATESAADTTANAAASAPAPDMTEAQEQAQRLNTQLESWVYVLPKYKFDPMTRRMAFYLTALPPTP